MVAGGHVSGGVVDATIITFTVLAGAMTGLRLYTRILIVRMAGVDDVLVSVGLTLSVLLTVTMCEQVVYGMGRHESSLTPQDGTMSLRWFWASVWIYYLALWAVKISILFQYLRILPENGYRKACYGLMGVVSAWTVWAFFSAVFACSPVHAFWDLSIEGTCLNRLAVWFANAAVNIITDICTAVLPLPVLNSLRLPTRQKYILMVVFGLGGVTCLLSILRLQSLYVISKSTDISWDNPLAATWSSLEVNVGIICSCVPTLKGLFSRIFPALAFGDSYIRTEDSFRKGSVTQTTSHASTNFKSSSHRPEDLERCPTSAEAHELTTHRSLDNGQWDDSKNILAPPARPLVENDEARERAKEKVKRYVGFQRHELETRDWIHPVSRPRTEEEKAREKVRYYVQSRTFHRESINRRNSNHGDALKSDAKSTISLCQTAEDG